jgi:hypothetical protein
MIPVGKSMHVRAYSGQILRWLAGHRRGGAHHVLLVWLGANSTTAGMVFLVLVVWWATQAGIVLSLYMAASVRRLLRLFFLPPIHTFGWSARRPGWRWSSFALWLPGGKPAGGARAKTGHAGRAAAGGRGKVFTP